MGIRIYTPDTQKGENTNPASENAKGDREEIQGIKLFNLFISTFDYFANVYVANNNNDVYFLYCAV